MLTKEETINHPGKKNPKTLVGEYMAEHKCNLRTAQRAVKENMKISIEPLKTKWEEDAELRAEFRDDFKSFKAYMENVQG